MNTRDSMSLLSLLSCTILLLSGVRALEIEERRTPSFRFRRMQEPSCGGWAQLPAHHIVIYLNQIMKKEDANYVNLMTCPKEDHSGCDGWFQHEKGLLHDDTQNIRRASETDWVYFVPCDPKVPYDSTNEWACTCFQISEKLLVNYEKGAHPTYPKGLLKKTDEHELICARTCVKNIPARSEGHHHHHHHHRHHQFRSSLVRWSR